MGFGDGLRMQFMSVSSARVCRPPENTITFALTLVKRHHTTAATMRRRCAPFIIVLLLSTLHNHATLADDVEKTAEDQDRLEVDNILGATDIIKEIKKQREKHAVQLMEIEKTMETELKSFYKKHDAALSKLRTIDSELRQHVNNLESKVIAEAQALAENAPSYSSWVVSCAGLVVTIIGVYIYWSRAMQNSLSAKYL